MERPSRPDRPLTPLQAIPAGDQAGRGSYGAAVAPPTSAAAARTKRRCAVLLAAGAAHNLLQRRAHTPRPLLLQSAVSVRADSSSKRDKGRRLDPSRLSTGRSLGSGSFGECYQVRDVW